MSTTRINFATVPVADQDRAIAFYRDVLGFEVTLDAPYKDDWRWIFMALPEAETRLHFAGTEELTWKAGLPVLALVSDNVDADAKRMRGLGVEIAHGPEDAPWAKGVRYLQIRDSEGNLLLLESLAGDA